MKRVLFGFALSFTLIVLLLSRVDHAKVFGYIKQAQWSLLILMQMVKIIVCEIKARRWGYAIQSATGGDKPKGLFSATMIAFLGNWIFPARLGELLRVQIFHKRNPHITRSLALTCSLLPMIFDLLLVLLLLLVGFSMRHQGSMPYGKTFVMVSLAVSALVGLHLFHRLFPKLEKWFAPLTSKIPEKPRKRLGAIIHEVNIALALLQEWKRVFVIFGYTCLIWALEIVAVSIGLYAFGITPTPAMAVIATMCLSLTFLLPVTPGALGAYQAAAIWSLGLFGIQSETALASSLGMQASDVTNVLILGFICFYREGLSLKSLSIKKDPKEQENTDQQDNPTPNNESVQKPLQNTGNS